MSEPSTEPSGLDELRRRLYSPDASAEDVARYEAAAAGPSPALDRPEAVEAVEAVSRRRGWPVVAVVAAVALAVGTAVGVAAGRSPSSASSSPSSSPSAAAVAGPAAIIAGDVPTPASDRAAFVAALGAGKQAGLLDYLFRYPDRLPAQLRTVQRAASTEYTGSGRAVLPLSPSALAERGGRATVILVLARPGGYGWRAIRISRSAVGSLAQQNLATDDGRTEAGAPVVATFAYGRGAPMDLSVTAAPGTRWGAVVVFTN